MVVERQGEAVANSRAIVLTFDNLGEASELERGTWDAQAPLGDHPSVAVVLPKLLETLRGLEMAATFFVEALNCELYPRAVREIAARGHELGVHGWRHETWSRLSSARERALLARADRAFASLGVQPRGFRPPGGEPTDATEPLLRELGYLWWSPVGEGARYRDGLATIPFEWDLVDAYHLMERFGELRVQRGDRRAPLRPREAAERLTSRLAHGAGTQTVVRELAASLSA
jgi:peptidoglycan/xylan/chitin deacetylase (PgdA/CDA1 family)